MASAGPPLRVSLERPLARLVIDRPDADNAISGALLEEMNRALSRIEADAGCRLVVLEGRPGVFCTGMDLGEATGPGDPAWLRRSVELYFATLRRLVLFPRPVICLLDGRVLGGGVGLVAACDVVLASRATSFALPEALWGLLPANVLPFLIRRVGFQNAYRMALTTQPVTAAQAREMQLVDQLADDLPAGLRQFATRLVHVPDGTIGRLKALAHRLWIMSPETERLVVEESLGLAADPEVRQRIRDFIAQRATP